MTLSSLPPRHVPPHSHPATGTLARSSSRAGGISSTTHYGRPGSSGRPYQRCAPVSGFPPAAWIADTGDVPHMAASTRISRPAGSFRTRRGCPLPLNQGRDTLQRPGPPVRDIRFKRRKAVSHDSALETGHRRTIQPVSGAARRCAADTSLYPQTRIPIIGRGSFEMAQTYGATTDLRRHAEAILDEWIDATADAVVEPHELTRITVLIETLPEKAAYVDDTVRGATTYLKNGLSSKIVKRTLKEHEALYGSLVNFEAEKERRHRDNGNDAA